MFDLKSPCVDCPFRKDRGSSFRLGEERLLEIFEAVAFQCHKTVVYNTGVEDEEGFEIPAAGEKPQQCAGLMAILHREGRPNQIMQIAQRLTGFDASTLDPRGLAYATIADALAGHDHSHGEHDV